MAPLSAFVRWKCFRKEELTFHEFIDQGRDQSHAMNTFCRMCSFCGLTTIIVALTDALMKCCKEKDLIEVMESNRRYDHYYHGSFFAFSVISFPLSDYRKRTGKLRFPECLNSSMLDASTNFGAVNCLRQLRSMKNSSEWPF